MPNVAVFDVTGKKVSDIELSESIFGIVPNTSAMHLAVVAYLANQRQGTQSTRTRSEVSGGGKKPWRQKGSGRARQGSTRAPQWYHGGIAHGPKPRSYRLEDEMIVLDDLKLDAIKTKEVAKVLAALETGKKTLLVLPEKNDVIYRSARNIAGVKVALVNTLNVYDILNCNSIVVLKDAVAKIEEVYA